MVLHSSIVHKWGVAYAIATILASGVSIADDAVPLLVKAKIEEVTLYRDRAQVVRGISREFTPGRHVLLFDNIPAAIDEQSLQVNRQGQAILHDVRLKKVFEKTSSNTRLETLNNALQQANDKIRETDDRLSQLKAENTVLTRIIDKATNPQDISAEGSLDTTKWIKLADFHRDRRVKLDKEIRETEQQKRSLAAEQEKIAYQINFLNTDQGKEKNQVEVIIEVAKTNHVKLDLSYIVSGSSWTPLYDLRVNSEKQLIDLSYNAVIRQSTTEDWDNVKIKLSTAQPQLGGEVPKQVPQYLSLYNPVVENERDGKKDSLGAKLEGRADISFRQQAPQKKNAPVVSYDKPDNAPVATVEDKVSSAVFTINEKNTIKSDNTPHKVRIMQTQMPVTLHYSTVPKLAPYAYLKAGVVNKTEYPLLAGATNVFLDNNFVAAARIDTISPNETFWAYLGVDDGIKVKHKFINKFEEKSGVFSKVQKYTYEFQFEIENRKKREIELNIMDQLPISRDKEIVVKLLSDRDKVEKIDDHQFIFWKFKPKAGEKLSIPLKYSIEYPADKKLSVSGAGEIKQFNRLLSR